MITILAIVLIFIGIVLIVPWIGFIGSSYFEWCDRMQEKVKKWWYRKYES